MKTRRRDRVAGLLYVVGVASMVAAPFHESARIPVSMALGECLALLVPPGSARCRRPSPHEAS